MSGSIKASSDGPGFNPPARMTIEEFKGIATFFKQFLADNPVIRVSIIAAGIGGALDAFHILWLFIKFVFRV